jgi:hypothetical protein
MKNQARDPIRSSVISDSRASRPLAFQKAEIDWSVLAKHYDREVSIHNLTLRESSRIGQGHNLSITHTIKLPSMIATLET